ncbi:16S rRNA (adenine(1518)-N(6)/adenine(1519)-N(6))-dimethyltransferase RsmA [Campylobacter insulaenigrae]|uniref:Ribosomal RNA small subunit methyltransferase A n=1 Tax=Campylobacter insulaenigrae NCTC 12927 TaxID=1031564 RepID=A0A0A8GYR3_9BACT|nr:16S rRNA (adenine(1518)-N(6)/adenine(1519)-N(6))-dimethyltransferase RsmA [Campylobacter insulaenigrae]AJC87033.1 16S rRNA (adenine1518-N6/adenine1519-N6)-dimethyltransferase [Campylobacter insulaenigrae NCTC 12927]VEH92512.1 dimethyladenosine transferase [Campylobacter insulaenigrae]
MIKAKKYFGQNFLCDKNVVLKITQAIPKDTKNIVEIGPGLGDLTQELLSIPQVKVKAYEIDKELIPILNKKFQNEIEGGNFELIHQDASIAFNNGSLSEKEYFLVANLPYYIATNLILKALEDDKCLGLIVMVQKEVAQKFCATFKESNFSALSILCELICKKALLFEIKPESFNPPPKVTSAVMKLEKVTNYKQKIQDLESFKIFLKDCFQNPRKQLVSNFKDKKDKILEIFRELNISPSSRAHEISVELYLKIFGYLKDTYERRKQNSRTK